MYYSVGGAIGSANRTSAVAFRPRAFDSTNRSCRILVTADTGTSGEAADTLQGMARAIASGEAAVAGQRPSPSSMRSGDDPFQRPVDLVLFNGDLSYAMGRASVWDSFFASMEPISSAVPVAYTVGNHEYDWAG